MNFEEKTIVKNYVYKGKILNLRNDEVLLPDGKTSKREIVEHSGGSAIYCENDGKVLLVKQFRYAYKKDVYELPAGKVNAGENPADTAVRELEEECGVKANRVELMFEIYPSPGYTDEVIRVYRATCLTQTKAHLDEGEFLAAKWFDKNELKKMIARGEINDGKTLVALLSELK